MKGSQSNAAFVIQFREGTDFQAGRLEGRVEHIASYKAARFHSVDELLAFIGGVLAESETDQPASRRGAEDGTDSEDV